MSGLLFCWRQIQMGLFDWRRSSEWHKRVDAAAAGKHPSLDRLADETFPWDALRWHTDTYLMKKGTLTIQQRQTCLAGLIMNHATKDVAIAACAHALDTRTVRHLLMSELSLVSGSAGLLPHLQAVAAARTVNKASVTDVEAHQAKVLMDFLKPGNETMHEGLRVLLPLLMTDDISQKSLLSRQISEIAHRACAGFAAQVEDMKSRGHWLQAYQHTRILLAFSHSFLHSENLNPAAEQTLNSVFPDWQVWSTWRPDQDRLQRWEAFTYRERASLHYLLALEGPDFQSRTETTLLLGLSMQDVMPASSMLDIQLKGGIPGELNEILDRLLRAVDKAVVPLLTYLCVDKPIGHETLQILEGAISAGDPSVNDALLQVLSANGGGERHTSIIEEQASAPVDAVLTLVRELGGARSQVLCKAIAPHLKNCASQCLARMQADLSVCLTCHAPSKGKAMKLMKFGNAIRETHWLHELLSPDVQITLQRWPKLSVMDSVAHIRSFAEVEYMTSLVAKFDAYCEDCLVQHRDTGADLSRLIDALVPFWQRTNDDKRRFIGLVVVERFFDTDDKICFRCLAQLPTLTNDFVQRLEGVYRAYDRLESPAVFECEELPKVDSDSVMACVNFACLLASEPSLEVIACWRLPLRSMIDHRKTTIVEQTLKVLSAEAWIHWISCLGTVYSDVFQNPFDYPAIPLRRLQAWTQHLCWEFLPTIKLLETALGSSPALHCILACGTHSALESFSDTPANGDENTLASQLTKILHAFKKAGKDCVQPSMQVAVGLLTRDGGNADKVSDIICLLAQATADGSLACTNIVEVQKQTSNQIAGVIFAAWFHAANLTTADKKALEALALFLNLRVDGNSLLPAAEDLDAATLYFDEQMAEMLQEARGLDALRIALRTADPDGTHELLQSLDINSPTLVDEALNTLPIALVDVVERVSDMEVEMQFPLTHLTALQRSAMDAADAQNLLVRLVLGDGVLPVGFCVHLDSDHNDATDDPLHYPWIMVRDSEPPNLPFCSGRASRATYELSRTLFRHLQLGFKSLNDVYTFVTDSLKNLAHFCIVCGSPYDTWPSQSPPTSRLHGGALRATFCEESACVDLFNRTSLDLRLSDLVRDPAVAELLLTAVYATAESGEHSLLPGCPVKEASQIKLLLNSVSRMVRAQARPLQISVTCTSDLLSWACCHYRGFLVSATERLRVPNLPTGTRQFVLANAAPEVEAAFAAHRCGEAAASHILFHGTTIERLFPILRQGLRVCSGTTLQRNGASYGHGIYMAQEPGTAWPYTAPSGLVEWDASPFNNMRVLLACEYLDHGATKSFGSPKIHVITDPTRLIVRYVFLLPAAATAPFARHVIPAVVSGIASLR